MDAGNNGNGHAIRPRIANKLLGLPEDILAAMAQSQSWAELLEAAECRPPQLARRFPVEEDLLERRFRLARFERAERPGRAHRRHQPRRGGPTGHRRLDDRVLDAQEVTERSVQCRHVTTYRSAGSTRSASSRMVRSTLVCSMPGHWTRKMKVFVPSRSA